MLAVADLAVAAPAFAFCVVNATALPLDVQAGGKIPVFYQGDVRPGGRVCHVPKRTDIGITVEIYQTGNVSGRQLKCRLSVPAGDSTITVGRTCAVQAG